MLQIAFFLLSISICLVLADTLMEMLLMMFSTVIRAMIARKP